MDEDLSTPQLIVAVTSLIGVLGTLIVSIGTYLKSKAEAFATKESIDDNDDNLRKLIENTASSLLSSCMKEIEYMKTELDKSREKIQELSDDYDKTVTELSGMKVQLAVLKRRNSLYVKCATELTNAVRQSIRIRDAERSSEIGPDCSACDAADEALLVQLKIIEKRFEKGEDIDN